MRSCHFDSFKTAKFLKSVALSRGVINQQAKVDQLVLTSEGTVRALKIDGRDWPVDFVIDASGLRRLGMGETFKEKWRSFTDTLILDRAMPFDMPHPKSNPELVSRSIAMNSGWLWNIPLQKRVGAGYVFSSQHIDEETAKREIENYLEFSIEPRKTIQFSAGNFKKIWRNNVLSIGLASGFVEPLEATSIGQMLEVLNNFKMILTEDNGIVGDATIESFNRSNHVCWNGIADFLRMHYDGGRTDTPFWQTVKELPRSDSYHQIRQCLKIRSMCSIDIEPYMGAGWASMFHVLNWLFISASLGIISKDAAMSELERYPEELRQQLNDYISQINPKNYH